MRKLVIFLTVFVVLQSIGFCPLNQLVLSDANIEQPTVSEKWKSKLGFEYEKVASNILCDGKSIWFASSDETLYCVNIDDEKKLLTYKPQKTSNGFGWVHESGNRIIFKSTLGLACFDRDSKKQVWAMDTKENKECKVGFKESILLYGTTNVDCLDIETGKLKWGKDIGGPFYVFVAESGLFIAPQMGRDGYLSSLDYATGNELWVRKDINAEKILIHNDNALVSIGKGVVCLSATTGQNLWQYDNGKNFVSIEDANDAYAIIWAKDGADNDNKGSICLDSKTGEVVWRMKDQFPEIKIVGDNKVLMWESSFAFRKHIVLSSLDKNEELLTYDSEDGRYIQAVDAFEDYVCVETAEKFFVFDLPKNSIAWSMPKSKHYDRLSSVDHDIVLIRTQDSCVQGFALANGEKILNIQTGDFNPSSVILHKDLVLVQANTSHLSESTSTLACVNKTDGETKWQRLFGAMTSTSGIKISCNWIFVAHQTTLEKCVVECLDADTGETVWKTIIEESYGDETTDPISLEYYDSKVYVTICSPGLVCCLDESSGELLWQWKSDGTIQPETCFSKDLCIVGTDNKELVCLDIDSGKPRWTYNKPKENEYVGVEFWDYDLSGNKAFAAIEKDIFMSFVCVDTSDGKKLWEYKQENASNLVFVKYENGKLYAAYHYLEIDGDFFERDCLICLNAKTGEKLWQYNYNGYMDQDPLFNSNSLFVKVGFFSTEDEYLCINKKTGKKTWGAKCNDVCAIYGFSCVNQKWAIAVGLDSQIHCYDALTGNELFSFAVDSYGKLPAEIEDNNVFISSTNGYLYCLKE
ncbi:MAG: PQQ-binding-like beta-propeller repeat protein [Caldisericia bacterium]|nr:PQQ-binding-like beta-propeller repeat protein [Caldisericia bacterium]